MPTKRRRLSTRQIGIPPAAIEAWQAGDAVTLARSLGIRPWQVNPIDAVGSPPGDDGPWAASWQAAAELRAKLVEIAGQPGRVGRHGEPLVPNA